MQRKNNPLLRRATHQANQTGQECKRDGKRQAPVGKARRHRYPYSLCARVATQKELYLSLQLYHSESNSDCLLRLNSVFQMLKRYFSHLPFICTQTLQKSLSTNLINL